MPIQSQGITRDNVSVDISAVAYCRVVGAVKSVVAIETVQSAAVRAAATAGTTSHCTIAQQHVDE